jgi:hypothetical protein
VHLATAAMLIVQILAVILKKRKKAIQNRNYSKTVSGKINLKKANLKYINKLVQKHGDLSISDLLERERSSHLIPPNLEAVVVENNIVHSSVISDLSVEISSINGNNFRNYQSISFETVSKLATTDPPKEVRMCIKCKKEIIFIKQEGVFT